MLVIYEMANNHGGDVKRGLEIINEFAEVAAMFPQFTHCMKYQYRDIDGGTFMHPSADRGHKYVKRFKETNLPPGKRLLLKRAASTAGFKTACTPFDEASVDMVVKHEYDYLKVGSPSFTDWSLWKKITKSWRSSIIASVGGATEKDIDRVVKMCRGHEVGFDLTLLHCISEYPAPLESLQLNQIDWLKKRYSPSGARVGFSSHEERVAEGAVIAAAKGVYAIERHVCLMDYHEAWVAEKPNLYSLTPEEMEKELSSVADILRGCGDPDIRVPGPKPTQFMRQMIDGRMCWKP